MRVVLAFLLLGALAAGCGSSDLCHCPNSGGVLTLPADLPAPVTAVAADSCALVSDLDGPTISFAADRATTCHVLLQLADGSEVTATLVFQPGAGCCSEILYVVDSSAFARSDGGAD